jgi:hypothetical protein
VAQGRHTPQVFSGSQADESDDRASADRRRLPELIAKVRETTSALWRAIRSVTYEFENTASSKLICRSVLLIIGGCMLLGGCRSRPEVAGPVIEFTRIPPAELIIY